MTPVCPYKTIYPLRGKPLVPPKQEDNTRANQDSPVLGGDKQPASFGQTGVSAQKTQAKGTIPLYIISSFLS